MTKVAEFSELVARTGSESRANLSRRVLRTRGARNQLGELGDFVDAFSELVARKSARQAERF